MEAVAVKWFQVLPSGSRSGSRNHFHGPESVTRRTTPPKGVVRVTLPGTTSVIQNSGGVGGNHFDAEREAL